MKLKSLGFAVVLVFLILPSASAINLTMESKNVERNVEFGLNIYLNSSHEIFAGQLDISFDPSILQFVRMEKGDYFGAGSLDTSDFGGMVVNNGLIRDYIAMRNFSQTTGVSGDGVFARIIFQSVAEGTSSISVVNTIWGNASAAEIVDPSEEINDGQVVVSITPVCGDGACTSGEGCGGASYCQADCGSCDNPGGNPGGSPGGSPGGGNPPSGNNTNNTFWDDFLNLFNNDDDDGNETCAENWQCESWSVCVDGEKFRDCTDLNNCTEDRRETKACGDANNGGVVVAGVISIASFIGLVVFVIMYFRTKHHVMAKREEVIKGAEKMRMQWK